MKPSIYHALPIVRINVAAGILLLFGLSQMAGDVLNNRVLKGIGAASVLAPFPKVFSDVDGVETFALKFILEYTRSDGTVEQLEVTPDVYSRMKGPYNRRNVYGAALSYGPTPKFPPDLFRQVFHYGLIDPGPLKDEFDLPTDIQDIKLIISAKTTGRNDQWILPATQ